MYDYCTLESDKEQIRDKVMTLGALDQACSLRHVSPLQSEWQFDLSQHSFIWVKARRAVTAAH